jgi:hypothetical protein
MGLIKQMLAIKLEKTLQMTVLVEVRTEGTFDQQGGAITNHFGNLGGSQGFQRQFTAQQIKRSQQIRKGVDQGAVEIKNQKLRLR